ncbi:MAG: endo-1,4-beta-xylanase, partial [Clostridia bacterium]|nr:endo-1,4-beta-xylanase [Clostridia bacterium]
ADIKLYYNDYNAYFADKAKAILALAQSVDSYATDAEGKPRKLIDGIGMQGYIGGYGTQSGCLETSHIGMIRSAINGYAAAGYEVQITEMAVRNFDIEAAQKHADFYAALFDTLKELGGEGPLRAVSIWGLTDYPNEPKGTYVYNLNSPYGGLFTENLDPKEAFDRVIDTLR